MFNVAGIFAQVHISIMRNVCIPFIVVTLFIALRSYEVCVLT